jgi:hypothetical protein
VFPINRIARYFPIAEPKEEDTPMTDTTANVETSETTSRPVRIRERDPRAFPVAHILQTFCLPGRVEPLTVELIVTATKFAEPADGEAPILTFDQMREYGQGGWQGFGTDDMDVSIRVIQ